VGQSGRGMGEPYPRRVSRSPVALACSEVGLAHDPDLVPAVAALAEAGLAADLVRWDDPDVDWSGFELCVVRSCWDYSWRRAEFLAWAGQVPRLRNDARVLAWNTDKTYLRELERQGVPVVPTVWDPSTADELPDAQEWVVKPSVSAGSRDTARWPDRTAALAHVRQLRETGRTAMVQPYQPSVDAEGETALLHLGGSFSHAVRKGALLIRGEGVRQDRQSRGSLDPVEASVRQREVGRLAYDAVAAALPDAAPLLYARVDVVAGPDGEPLVLEVELAEPSLFLSQGVGAPARFADAVRAAIAR
jgi:glutathione synthase/RimK-type ligase-like ATP-grasp enzyme